MKGALIRREGGRRFPRGREEGFYAFLHQVSPHRTLSRVAQAYGAIFSQMETLAKFQPQLGLEPKPFSDTCGSGARPAFKVSSTTPVFSTKSLTRLDALFHW